MPADLSLHDAIYTLRAMRRLKPDPIPDDVLQEIIEAATMASTGGNSQRWAFVVVTDPEQRRKLGEIYRDVGEAFIRDTVLANPRLPDDARRVYENAMVLVEHMGEAPAIVVPCVRGAPPTNANASGYYGSIYPAIQNLMLAARAHGLGSTLTTIHKQRDADVHAVLGLPDDVETIALIPLGYPKGKWGRPRRDPAPTVTHWDRWGNQRA